MLVWLGAHICNWLAIYVFIFLWLVVTFWPRFHSDYLAPSATALSKRSTIVKMFSLNYLPPLYVFSARTYEINYIDRLWKQSQDKNSWNFIVDSWQSAFAPWTANILFIIFENADGIHYLYGEGGRGEGQVLERRVRRKMGQSLLLILYICYY